MKLTTGALIDCGATCSFCGEKKPVRCIDPYVKHQNNFGLEYICAECEVKAQESIKVFDDQLDNILGIEEFTEENEEKYRRKLEQIKKDKENRIPNDSWFFSYIKTQEFKDTYDYISPDPSEEYKVWWKNQKYSMEPVIDNYEYKTMCNRGFTEALKV